MKTENPRASVPVMEASSYECDLRRLFRSPLDHLPASEQLARYRQRDLVPSHLYRLGTKLLGSHHPRRRVIDASLYTPQERTPHAQLIRRSWDGRTVASTSSGPESTNQTHLARTNTLPVSASLAQEAPRDAGGRNTMGLKARDFSMEDYRRWISERRELRASLDGLGASEAWLSSKERTPLEETLLSRLSSERRAAERKAPVSTTTEVS